MGKKVLCPYVLIRIGKTNWAIGQMLYIMLASVVYIFALQMMSVIILFPEISFSNDWGEILYTVSQIRISYFTLAIEIRYGILYVASPIIVTLLSFGMLWLEGVFLGILMFFANLKFGHSVGSNLEKLGICLTTVGCSYRIICIETGFNL